MSPNTLPIAQDTGIEAIAISPENLEIANCYLQVQDVRAVAAELDIPVDTINRVLARREIKSYIDNVFLDIGYNNRFKMRSAMDAVLQKKFQDMEEAGIGSNKDIAELLALSHKMAIEHIDKQIQLEKIRLQNDPTIKTQNNIQINDAGSNYANLLSKLLAEQ